MREIDRTARADAIRAERRFNEWELRRVSVLETLGAIDVGPLPWEKTS
jgi:hypothetical protein